MNSSLNRFLVFLGLCLIVAVAAIVFINSKGDDRSIVNETKIDLGVPYKEVLHNFRSTRYSTPQELYAAYEKVSQKLEVEKGNLTNYSQDKEDLLSSLATNIFPWADTICKNMDYKWEYLNSCAKGCQEIIKNKSVLKSSTGDMASSYNESLNSFITFEKHSKSKLNHLSGPFNLTVFNSYEDLKTKIQQDDNLKLNPYFSTEIETWTEDFLIWKQLEDALVKTSFKQDEPLASLNGKITDLKNLCNLFSTEHKLEKYDFYKNEFCNKSVEIHNLITKKIDALNGL